MSSLSSAMVITGLAAGGFAAFNQFQSGEKEKKAYEYNALIAEQEASLTKQGAKLNEFRTRKQLKEFVGQQAASYAKSGVELTGSPLDVMQDTVANAELEMSISRFNAEMASRGKISEAEMSRFYGREAKTASQIQAASTLLATAGEYGSKYTVPKKTKVGA